MKRNIVLSAIALLSAVGAAPVLAEDPTPEPPFTSTRTRAEVIAELKEFQRSGQNPWADSYDHLAGFNSMKTREMVKNEYLMAREEVAAMNAEDGGSGYRRMPERALARPLDPLPDGPVIAGQPVAETE